MSDTYSAEYSNSSLLVGDRIDRYTIKCKNESGGTRITKLYVLSLFKRAEYELYEPRYRLVKGNRSFATIQNEIEHSDCMFYSIDCRKFFHSSMFHLAFNIQMRDDSQIVSLQFINQQRKDAKEILLDNLKGKLVKFKKSIGTGLYYKINRSVYPSEQGVKTFRVGNKRHIKLIQHKLNKTCSDKTQN